MIVFKDKISKADLKKMQKFMKQGNNTRAVEFFIAKYVSNISEKYSAYLKNRIEKTSSLVSSKRIDSLSIEISSSTTGFEFALKRLFKKFITDVIANPTFKKFNITSPAVKKAIKLNTLNRFIADTKGALSRTNSSVLSSVRQYQVDLISANRRIERMADVGDILQRDVSRLKDQIKETVIKNNPDYENILRNDRFIKYRNGSMHKVDDYTDMASRTTALNVERTAVEIKESIGGRRVSEYFLRDHRQLQGKAREICKKILSRKFKGKSLVAHDSAAASLFGILTLTEAKAQGALGVYCRHSIRPLGKAEYNRIDRLLYLSENEVA